MPRKDSGRRTIEVTARFYDELKAEATQEERSMPDVLDDLVRDGRSMREWFGRLDNDLREMRREMAALRQDLAERVPAAAAPTGAYPATRYPGEHHG